MTEAVSGTYIAERISAVFPNTILEALPTYVTVPADSIIDVATFLRDDPEIDFKYLNSLTAVDRLDYFEIVYHLSSLAKNQSFVLKARAGHDNPVVPSVIGVWMGAHLQEREAYDLMGISFGGHPAMRRIFLWEGFPGHPLRKDFLALPGGFKPGLQRFPFEFPAGQRSYPSLQNTDAPTAAAVPRLGQPSINDPSPTEPTGGGTEVARSGSATEAPESAVEHPGGIQTDSEETARTTGELKSADEPEANP